MQKHSRYYGGKEVKVNNSSMYGQMGMYPDVMANKIYNAGTSPKKYGESVNYKRRGKKYIKSKRRK